MQTETEVKTEEYSRIRFTTAEEWTVNVLAAFLSSLSAMYEAIHARQLLDLEQAKPGDLEEHNESSTFWLSNFETLFRRSLERWHWEIGSERELLQHLRISSLEMSSPGQITLVGLGDVIRELREFIKDLWYRNRHERRRGLLELARQRMQLEMLGAAMRPVAEQTAIILADKVEAIEKLVQAGRLVDDPETLELIGPER